MHANTQSSHPETPSADREGRPATRASGLTPIRALVAEHEPSTREGLLELLGVCGGVDVVGVCSDGWQAVRDVRDLDPELLFLGVDLRKLDGFGVLEKTSGRVDPAVVFVAADDRFAVRAFVVHAIDYVLKPIARERLGEALERARKKIAHDRLRALAGERKASRPESYLRRLVVKEGGRLVFLRMEDVDWIQAAGNHLEVHAAGERHCFRRGMRELEGELDPAAFMRIHRSTIVNIDRIKEMRSRLHGDYRVVLRDGEELTMSAGYREKLDVLRRRGV